MRSLPLSDGEHRLRSPMPSAEELTADWSAFLDGAVGVSAHPLIWSALDMEWHSKAMANSVRGFLDIDSDRAQNTQLDVIEILFDAMVAQKEAGS